MPPQKLDLPSRHRCRYTVSNSWRVTLQLLRCPLSADLTDRADAPRVLAVMLIARTVINIPMRIVYPFLPAISRGLGVSLETASLLFALGLR